MTISDEERTAAKVEELDKMIAELQKRRRELLDAGSSGKATSMPAKADVVESRAAARPAAIAQPTARTTGPGSKGALERDLDSLPWKSFKKKEGEWAFFRDREGRLIDELQSSKDFVDRLRKEGEVVVGKYRYQISEDKFLNRYYEGGKTG